MSVQPEAITFESQWMGKLSDCTFTSETNELPDDCLTGSAASFVIGSSRDVVPLDVSQTTDCAEAQENTECSAWNNIQSTLLHPERSARAICRPTKCQDGDAKQFSIVQPALGSNIGRRSNTSDKEPLWPIRSLRSSSVTLEETWTTNPLSSLEQDKQTNVLPTQQWKSTISSRATDKPSGSPSRTSTPNFISGSLRAQQQNMWSKSVPQHLHGLDPFTSLPSHPQPVSSLLSDHNTSYSVPDSDRLVDGLLNSFLSTTFEESSNMVNPTDYFGPNQSSTNDSLPLSAFDEERGLQRPDGADRPDEHMWLYEDPQGRTQGSFSDAQMNEWLQAGLYFTANLRVRRTCDDTFSPLADYTSFFGRVPFTPGSRVAPIRGGITSAMLNSVTTSVHSAVLPLANDLTVSNPIKTVDRCNVTSIIDMQNCSNTVLNGDVSNQGDPSLSASVRTIAPSNQRSTYGTRFEQTIVDCSLAPGTLSCSSISSPCIERHSTFNMAAVATSGSADFSSMNNRSFCQQSVLPVIQDLTNLGLSTFGNGLLAYEAILSGGNASDISPGFLSALAQYLNGQSHVIGHQSATPMQQLAETAQLAAQLAAMAGAHSPNQTPMQPAQALALAQFVMARSNSSLSNGTPGKKDGIPDGVSDFNTSDAVARLPVNGELDNDILYSNNSAPWSNFANGVGNRSSTRVSNEGSFTSKMLHENSGGMGEANEISSTTQRLAPTALSFRASTGRSSLKHGSKVSPISNGSKYSNVQNDSLVSEQLLPQQSQHHSEGHGFWSWSDEQANSSFGAVLGPEQDGSSQQTILNRSTTGNQWVNKVKQVPAKSSNQVSRTPGIRSGVRSETSWSTSKQNGSSSVTCNNQFKQTLSSSIGNSGSSTGSSSSPPKNSLTNKSLPHGMVHTKGGKSSSVASYISTGHGAATTTTTHPQQPSSDHTAKQELDNLTQWCQTRLESVPMREKVDIPTVVELLATLDAPYEVERMVQTFLGESTRTSQFVKDFLDRRRPFWQLHRERRERESLSLSQPTTSAVSSSTLRSSDKKKQKTTSTHDSSAPTTRSVTQTCWAKVGTAQATDATQDSQWHQIKPKGNHGRKPKKDKAL